MTTDSFFVCNQRWTDLVLEGVREILAEQTLDELLADMRQDSAQPADFSRLRAALEQRYGIETANGVLLRAGRAVFTNILKSYSVEMGFEELDFRLLAPRKKVLKGMQLLAGFLTAQCGCAITVSSQNGFWLWSMADCFECAGIDRKKPLCYFTVGMLQEFMMWVSSGRTHPLRESGCCAMGGSACMIEIEQRALD
ncbi:MAG: 4-vinyl reductase [Chloroflexota bacterium]